MSKYIIEIDEEILNKQQMRVDGFTRPIEEIICDSIDFYFFSYPTDKKYIKIEKFEV